MNPRAKGMRFEAKIRADLEKKGWIVSKWQNNVAFQKFDSTAGKIGIYELGKLIPARQGKYRLTSTGFPDFIVFTQLRSGYKLEKIDLFYSKSEAFGKFEGVPRFIIVGLECKSNGYLDKEEKFKCKWLLDNNIFSKILIASKGTKRGQIVYKEFK